MLFSAGGDAMSVSLGKLENSKRRARGKRTNRCRLDDGKRGERGAQ